MFKEAMGLMVSMNFVPFQEQYKHCYKADGCNETS
jgi:hypothetical protein